MNSKNLTTTILLAMLFGGILGGILNLFFMEISFVKDFLVGDVFHVIGKIFINLLKMLVVPLVFVSLVCGVAALGDIKKLGRLGGKALLFYLGTTALAITLALSLAVIVAPGEGFNLSSTTDQEFTAKESPSIAETIINLIPNNPIEAMAEGQMLPLIVFSILFGIAIVMAGESGRRIEQQFNDYNAIIMQIVMIVIMFAPIGVFCLIAKTFALQGFEVFKPLMSYFMVVVAALLIHALVSYSILIKLLSGLNVWRFFKKMRGVQIFAFSTASSNATIPINIENAENKLGVDNSVASFTIPLGATINMDGTAIMQGVATVFIANVYGIDLGLVDYLLVILTATLASVGTAGVPGVGLIMLAMVLNQVGLPVEGIALIIGVDRLLDMMRTAVNVTGDAAATVIIAKSEGNLDRNVYNN
ncbi:MAG: dicarboxylate/amino acid:cation symporter [Candidatus Parabeggiatoa sp. nov. 3]|nr:MAG: dicarboxylate/amino acid:cation symporter [Gammaproteobacteria bacterium]RKZ55780.1 MAG: dicarboxylate/amino acid:cation symporter [Gammaproteobacteria bacterium]RKZ84118.1 MAG: dicarboxylate/amino acid:cation symporter [Gammaproteobacteria bacterium]